MEYKSIGKKIQQHRTNLGLTQQALAETVDLSVSYMGAIERGKKLPKLKVFIDIANALHISADALLCDVLEVSNEIIATDLSKRISQLPQSEQHRILNVVETMVSDNN